MFNGNFWCVFWEIKFQTCLESIDHKIKHRSHLQLSDINQPFPCNRMIHPSKYLDLSVKSFFYDSPCKVVLLEWNWIDCETNKMLCRWRSHWKTFQFGFVADHPFVAFADQSICLLVQKAPDERLQWPSGTLDATSDTFGNKPCTQSHFWITSNVRLP